MGDIIERGGRAVPGTPSPRSQATPPSPPPRHGRTVCHIHGTVITTCRCIHAVTNERPVPCPGVPTCSGAVAQSETDAKIEALADELMDLADRCSADIKAGQIARGEFYPPIPEHIHISRDVLRQNLVEALHRVARQ